MFLGSPASWPLHNLHITHMNTYYAVSVIFLLKYFYFILYKFQKAGLIIELETVQHTFVHQKFCTVSNFN